MTEIHGGKTQGKTAELYQQLAEYRRVNPKAIVQVVSHQDDLVDRSAVGNVFPEYGLMKRFNAFP